MSLAGPLSNFVLVLVSALLIRLGMMAGVFAAPAEPVLVEVAVGTGSDFWANAAMGISILFSLNLILGILNLFPLPPLDGSGAITLLMRRETAAKFRHVVRQPGLSLFGLLAVWYLFWPVFKPIWLFALNLLYPGQNYQPV